jgi:predicted TIM-barrel fold metal-dependent hydrolase
VTRKTGDKPAREIREQIGHPLIDGDAHHVEVRAAFHRYVVDQGYGHLFERDPLARNMLVPAYDSLFRVGYEERRRRHVRVEAGWFTPANTLDYATVSMPGLLYERINDAGFDFSIVYPTYGIFIAHIQDNQTRCGIARLYNEMVAEDYAPYSDKLTPAAVIPLSTPEEGIEELEHAVSLGLKAFLIPSYVWRVIPQFADAPMEYRARLTRLDAYGLDSEYDYDPFWRRAEQLGSPLSTHMPMYAGNDRISPSNYMYTHPGMFTASAEAIAKSLFLGGVLHRFPRLKFGLLEGGVAIGVRLLEDFASRFDKRGPEAIKNLDLRNIDTAELARMAEKYNPRLVGIPEADLIPSLAIDEGGTNDFAASGTSSPQDIREQWTNSLFWGCEGDDPLVAVAYQSSPTVPAFIGSDIGHWDVPNFDHPLQEAYEQIEDGWLTPAQFKQFSFDNAVRFYAGSNPDFFKGTTVESEAGKVLQGKAQ